MSCVMNREGVNRSSILYIRSYTSVQHDKSRRDGVQQYHYSESTVPVRDRTTLYRGVRGRPARASGRTRSAAGRHTCYDSRV